MKNSVTVERESRAFSLSLAACVTFGYLFPTVGNLIIDPLVDHKLWGIRPYPWGWWLVPPIAVLVFMSTYLLFRRSNTNYQRLAAAVGPLSAFYVISFPIFPPEIPHTGLAWIGAVWVALTGGGPGSLYHVTGCICKGLERLVTLYCFGFASPAGEAKKLPISRRSPPSRPCRNLPHRLRWLSAA